MITYLLLLVVIYLLWRIKNYLAYMSQPIDYPTEDVWESFMRIMNEDDEEEDDKW